MVEIRIFLMKCSNDLHSFTWHDRSSTKLSSFDASSNEHILDLVSVPGPHVTEHEPDHSPHSLKNISSNSLKKNGQAIRIYWPYTVFNCESCFDRTGWSFLRNESIDKYCIMCIMAILVQHWICIVDKCIHCWLNYIFKSMSGIYGQLGHVTDWLWSVDPGLRRFLERRLYSLLLSLTYVDYLVSH